MREKQAEKEKEQSRVEPRAGERRAELARGLSEREQHSRAEHNLN